MYIIIACPINSSTNINDNIRDPTLFEYCQAKLNSQKWTIKNGSCTMEICQ